MSDIYGNNCVGFTRILTHLQLTTETYEKIFACTQPTPEATPSPEYAAIPYAVVSPMIDSPMFHSPEQSLPVPSPKFSRHRFHGVNLNFLTTAQREEIYLQERARRGVDNIQLNPIDEAAPSTSRRHSRTPSSPTRNTRNRLSYPPVPTNREVNEYIRDQQVVDRNIDMSKKPL